MAKGGYLRLWPASDPSGKGNFSNGSAEYYHRDRVQVLVERDGDGLIRLEIVNTRGKPLTLDQIAHARANLGNEAEVLVWPVAMQQRNDAIVLVQMATRPQEASSGIVLAR